MIMEDTEIIFQNSKSCIVIYKAIDNGEDFEIIDLNKAVEKTEQVSRANIIGKRVTEVFPGVEEFGLLDVFRRVLRTGVPEHHPESHYQDHRLSGWRDIYVHRVSGDKIAAIYEDVTERVREREEIQYLNRLLHAIRNVNQTIAIEQDSSVMLQKICEALVETNGYNGCWIKLHEPDRLYTCGFQEEQKIRVFLADNTPKCTAGLKPREIRVCDDPKTCEDCVLYSEHEQAVLVGSISYLDQVFGEMLVTAPLDRVQESEVGLFREVVGDVGFAVHSHRLAEMKAKQDEVVKRYYDGLDKLLGFSNKVSRLYTVEEIADLTLDALRCTLNYSHGGFIAVEGDMFVAEVLRGDVVNEYSQSIHQTSVLKRAFQTKQTQLVPDTRVDPDFILGPAEGIYHPYSELCVPVLRDDDVVALINVEVERLDAFSSYDVKLVETMANILSSQYSTIDYLGRLQESEHKLTMILGEALDGVSVNVDRRLVYVNQALCNMLGYTREELLSMDVIDLHAPEYREGVKEYTSMRQKREAAPGRHVVKLLRKDGAQVDVEYQVSLIDWMGETASLTYVRDVSERKRFEVTLQTLHESALAFNEIDSYEDIIEESLNILEKIVGYRYLTFLRVEEEALVTASTRGAPVLDLVLPLSGPGITVRAVREKKTQQVNDTSIDPDFVKGSTDSLSELAVPVIVEDDVWAVLNVESQERDAFTQEDLILVETLSSHVSSAVSRMMDQENRVKEALMYQRMIEASEKRYRTLVESSPDLIIEHDLEGNIVFYNEAAERFLGFDPDTSIEMNVLDVVPPEYLGELEERSRKRGTWDMGVFSYELKLINASGELVPVLINSTPIQENGTVKSILLMIRNVSEYKRLQNERTEALLDAREAKIRAEEAEKLAQLKTRFMSTATHELRTPLTVIQGYLELLKDTIDANTESANQYLEIVERNTMRLNK
ncbi:hypothetical protein DRO31_08425, partial [Candidatus Bathyarchaeota archaeon]